jgi:hypothetical protein
MPNVYLETTIPSYLASRPSRDLVVAAHQQVTHDWWTRAKDSFEIFVSEAVLDEIRAGDPALASRRLGFVEDLPVLASREEVETLTRLYSEQLGLPLRARADLVHIAFAVSYRLDYLLTWNCKHIANGHVIRRLYSINAQIEKTTPIIVTPEELQPW